MTTGQTLLWVASNIISFAFGVVFGIGAVLSAFRKQAATLVEQQERAARVALQLRKEFGLLGDEKK